MSIQDSDLDTSFAPMPVDLYDAERQRLGVEGAAYADRICHDGLLVVDEGTHGCGHDAELRLNPAVLPEWLCAAVPGKVHGPEAGWPQIFRTWSWVDWPDLARRHPITIQDDGDDFPTSQVLAEVAARRRDGRDAAADVYVFVAGVEQFEILADEVVEVVKEEGEV